MTAADSPFGFLSSAAGQATIPVVITRKHSAHIAGCRNLKPNPVHRHESVPVAGFQPLECCKNMPVPSALAAEIPSVSRLNALQSDVDELLGDVNVSEFDRIGRLETLLASCADVHAGAPRAQYRALVQALIARLTAARSLCSDELAEHQFRMSQIARIAVGSPREDWYGRLTWRRGNKEMFSRLGGIDDMPFSEPLHIYGAVADYLDSGVSPDRIPSAVAELVELFMTCTFYWRYAVPVRDLKDHDRSVAAGIDAQVRQYLENIDSEARSPSLQTGNLRHAVVLEPTIEDSAQRWWARRNDLHRRELVVLKVDSLTLEWMRRSEFDFAESSQTRCSLREGQGWVRQSSVNRVIGDIRRATEERSKTLARS